MPTHQQSNAQYSAWTTSYKTSSQSRAKGLKSIRVLGTLLLVTTLSLGHLPSTEEAPEQTARQATSADPTSETFDPATAMATWQAGDNWQLSSEELMINRLTVGPIHADHANITAQSTAHGTFFTLEQADFYGGKLSGSVAQHPATGTIALRLTFSNLALPNLLANFGSTSSSQGTINGTCSLLIPDGDFLRSHGEATLSMHGGQLLANATVADVLLLNFLSSPGRDAGSVRLEIGNGTITLRDAFLANDQLAIAIRGTISLTGDLDLRIDPEMKSEPISKVPLLGQAFNAMIGATTSHMARLRVGGTIDKPEISVRPF